MGAVGGGVGGGGGGVGGGAVGGAGGGREELMSIAAERKIAHVSETMEEGVWQCEEFGHDSKQRNNARVQVATKTLPPHGSPDQVEWWE
jgi:hypothetical protein